MKKKILSMIVAVVLVCALAVPAGAYNMGKVGERNFISCGFRHTAAIDENGSLWTWGDNLSGQLGNGGRGNVNGYRTINQTVPVKVLENVVSVSCGYEHTAAIQTDGSLWTWGCNFDGELGNGSREYSAVPAKVMDDVAAVSCGNGYTAAIKIDGTLWMWGASRHGKLGNGSTEKSLVPVKVLDNVAAVCCGMQHTAAIQTDGTLWTWGINDYSQLGGTEELFCVSPVKVLDNVVAVGCGENHTAALKTDGSLWMWGGNEMGQLGTAWPKAHQTYPRQVMDNVAAVSCGRYHTAIIQADGSLWMCGAGHDGKLGSGMVNERRNNGYGGLVPAIAIPVKVMDNVAAVSGGMEHTAAVQTNGSLWTWGGNSYGQLGNGGGGNVEGESGYPCQNVPIQIALAEGVSMPRTAYASTQSVLVDGRAVEFQMYALKDASGNLTNYVKLRDVASVLNGTAAQFNVGWDGAVNIEADKAYAPNGSEMQTPYSGNRAYETATAPTNVNGSPVELEAIVLKDDKGGAYTYYKLRDLGEALGFAVDWSADKGVFLETGKPYVLNN